MADKRYLHLNINMKAAGSHDGAWRHPHTDVSKINDFGALVEFARRAEAAKIDALFWADGLALSTKSAAQSPHWAYEPLTLAGALTARTQRIGVIGTVSTTYTEPYNLARQLASLDRISGGRVGWNVVTTGGTGEGAAANFGLEGHPVHEHRYRRAHEYIDVIHALFDSWQPGALVADQHSGVFVDATKVGPINHSGEFFRVAGPLNVQPARPGDRPLLVQAGGSEQGRELGAKYADLIYSISQTIEDAKEYADDIRTRAQGYGRDPDSIKILTGFYVLVGQSVQHAKEKEQELLEFSDPSSVIKHVSGITNLDLTKYPLDAPLPETPAPTTVNGIQTHLALLHQVIDRTHPTTLRELAAALGGGVGAIGVASDAAGVADTLQEWFESGVVDGFNIGIQQLQGGAEDFFDLVVPELTRRGLRPPDYLGTTLKDTFSA